MTEQRAREPIEDRDAAQIARRTAGALRRRAYDRLQTEAMSDIDAADFHQWGMVRFVPGLSINAPYRRTADR